MNDFRSRRLDLSRRFALKAFGASAVTGLALISGVRAIAALTERADQFTLLDVGCGDGEIPRRTHQWAKSKGITCSGLGVDLTSESIELARALTSPDAPLTFSQADLFDLGDEDTFDIVHTSLMLHHLNDEEAERALRTRWSLRLEIRLWLLRGLKSATRIRADRHAAHSVQDGR